MLAQIQHFKDEIPEFVIKLYHILQKPEYHDYIAWAAHDTQILIKQPKKLEDRVLPYFFRHKHLSSFIRQLNMYRFSKVNKISKERSWMYFKNDHFKRGEIEQMRNIKRTQTSKKKQRFSEGKKEHDSDQNTIKDQSLVEDATSYRIETEKKLEDLQNILEGIAKKNPFVYKQLMPALQICQNLTGKPYGNIDQIAGMPSLGNLYIPNENQQNQNDNAANNMLGNTVRDFIPMQSIILPSLCSLSHFDGI